MEEMLAQLNGLQQNWLPLAMQYGARVLLAIVVLLIGWWVIGRLTTGIQSLMERRRIDRTLHGFIGTLVGVGLKVLLVVSVAGMVGVETTSFIALIGAAGLTIGLALQGSLANFAGGMLILILRPFRAGEYIEVAGGIGGTVDTIQIFHTILKTADNKTVVLPNGSLSNGVITNHSRQPTRRVDLNIAIAYSDDLKQARDILLGLVESDERVLKMPAPVVLLVALNSSTLNLSLRVWTKTANATDVLYDIQERTKEAFDREGISIR